MHGSMGTVQPHRCPLEDGGEGLVFAPQSDQLLEKRCGQVRRYGWSLGVVAVLCSKIQELCL